MNKLLVILTSALALTVSSTGFSQDDGMKPYKQRPNHHRGAPGMPVVGRLFHAIKRLDLDETQETSLREIMDTMREDLRPVMEATREGHMQLKELIDADTYDETVVTSIADKQGDLAAERLIITSRAMSDALQLLTEEQRAELESMAEERRERRAERRAKRKSRAG